LLHFFTFLRANPVKVVIAASTGNINYLIWKDN